MQHFSFAARNTILIMTLGFCGIAVAPAAWAGPAQSKILNPGTPVSQISGTVPVTKPPIACGQTPGPASLGSSPVSASSAFSTTSINSGISFCPPGYVYLQNQCYQAVSLSCPAGWNSDSKLDITSSSPAEGCVCATASNGQFPEGQVRCPSSGNYKVTAKAANGKWVCESVEQPTLFNNSNCANGGTLIAASAYQAVQGISAVPTFGSAPAFTCIQTSAPNGPTAPGFAATVAGSAGFGVAVPSSASAVLGGSPLDPSSAFSTKNTNSGISFCSSGYTYYQNQCYQAVSLSCPVGWSPDPAGDTSSPMAMGCMKGNAKGAFPCPTGAYSVTAKSNDGKWVCESIAAPAKLTNSNCGNGGALIPAGNLPNVEGVPAAKTLGNNPPYTCVRASAPAALASSAGGSLGVSAGNGVGNSSR